VTLLVPAALAGLLALPVIYLIHLLWGSRRRLVVPAVFLWAGLSSVPSGRARRRWPPLGALLLLQLAAAALLAVALTRPATSAPPPTHLVIVMDASASMQATDVSPTRFEAARGQALARLAALSTGDQASLIRAGATATLVASGSAGQAREALARLTPGIAPSALREALALASTEAQATPTATGQIVLLTDAAWPPFAPPGALAAPVEIVPVGGGADNRAIVNLQVRTEPGGTKQAAFVEVANYADHAVSVPLRTLGDDVLLDERALAVPARGRVGASIQVPSEVRRVTARLLGRDALPLDDVAEAMVPLAQPRDVHLVSRAPTTLQKALAAIPSVRLTLADPSSDTPIAADLTVLDGTLPPQLPPGALLLVNPPPDSPPLSQAQRPVAEATASADAAPELGLGLELLKGIDLQALQAESSFGRGSPPWASVVFAARDGPLVLQGRLAGRPTVVLAFDPVRSGVEKSLAFPLLIANAAGYLLAQQGDLAVRAGQPVTLPAPASGRLTVVRPDGAETTVAADTATNTVVIDGPDEIGRYAVRDPAGAAPTRWFSVSLLDGAASDIRPRPRPLASLPGPAPLAAPAQPPVAEWWRWPAVAGLGVLLVEWLVFARRG